MIVFNDYKNTPALFSGYTWRDEITLPEDAELLNGSSKEELNPEPREETKGKIKREIHLNRGQKEKRVYSIWFEGDIYNSIEVKSNDIEYLKYFSQMVKSTSKININICARLSRAFYIT